MIATQTFPVSSQSIHHLFFLLLVLFFQSHSYPHPPPNPQSLAPCRLFKNWIKKRPHLLFSPQGKKEVSNIADQDLLIWFHLGTLRKRGRRLCLPCLFVSLSLILSPSIAQSNSGSLSPSLSLSAYLGLSCQLTSLRNQTAPNRSACHSAPWAGHNLISHTAVTYQVVFSTLFQHPWVVYMLGNFGSFSPLDDLLF